MAKETQETLPDVNWETAEPVPLAPAWEPKNTGDALVGVVKDIATKQTKYGERELLTIIKDSDNSEMGVWLSARLMGYAAQFKQGRRVRIAYNGMVNTPNGKAHDYVVQFEK